MRITEAQFLKLMGLLQSSHHVCDNCSGNILSINRKGRGELLDEILFQHDVPLTVVENKKDIRKIRTE
jgi:hypothetical protein